jgi:hypothetical protein
MVGTPGTLGTNPANVCELVKASFAIMEEQPTADDDRELQPPERARLAMLAIRLAYGGDDVPADIVHEQLHRLSRRIKINDAHALHLHKTHSAEKAALAAEAYLQGAGSLAQICAAYGVTQRTLERNVARLRAREASNV